MTKTYVKTNNTEAKWVESGHIIAGKEYEVTNIVEYSNHKQGFIELENLGMALILINMHCLYLDNSFWEVVER